jgi:hypothetical protein
MTFNEGLDMVKRNFLVTKYKHCNIIKFDVVLINN